MIVNVSHETKYRCSGCPTMHSRKGQRYCNSCHAAYMRSWRPENFEKKVQAAVEKRLEEIISQNRQVTAS